MYINEILYWQPYILYTWVTILNIYDVHYNFIQSLSTENYDESIYC